MITVHNLNHSRSIRIIWLLEELGLDYEIKQYERRKSDSLAPEEYRKLHPLGKAPTVTDGDLVLAESGAIVDTILARYGEGRLTPTEGSQEWIDYRFWMHACEGSLMPLLLLRLIMNKMDTKSPFFVRPLIKVVTGKVNGAYLGPNLERFLSFSNDTLSKHTWLAGESFTAADVMTAWPLEVAVQRGGFDNRFPEIKNYVARCYKREAYVRALEKNGPFETIG